MNMEIQGADFLDTLLLRNNITIKDLADQSNERYGELMDMERIFDLETESDFACCLTIPLLLDPLAAQKIIEYFREEEHDSLFSKTAQPDIEKYRLLLVSAFVFNPAFFAMAWNWCAFIRQELQLQLQLQSQLQIKKENFKIFKYKPNVLVSVKNVRQQLHAASGKGQIQNIGNWPIDVDNELFGYLTLNVISGAVRFKFKFAAYFDEPPCFVEVKCKSKEGNEYSNVIINQIERNSSENQELIIISDVLPNFNYLDLDSLEVKFIENH